LKELDCSNNPPSQGPPLPKETRFIRCAIARIPKDEYERRYGETFEEQSLNYAIEHGYIKKDRGKLIKPELEFLPPRDYSALPEGGKEVRKAAKRFGGKKLSPSRHKPKINELCLVRWEHESRNELIEIALEFGLKQKSELTRMTKAELCRILLHHITVEVLISEVQPV
jgi:hypothetical protein